MKKKYTTPSKNSAFRGCANSTIEVCEQQGTKSVTGQANIFLMDFMEKTIENRSAKLVKSTFSNATEKTHFYILNQNRENNKVEEICSLHFGFQNFLIPVN